jgi:cold shock CspA family protein
VADAKLAGLLDQIDERTRRSILQKLQPTLGVGVAHVNLTVQPQSADRSVRNRSRAVQVAVVEEHIRLQFPVGDLAVGEHWIAGRVDMDWAPLQDGETVLFCGYAGPLLVALSGSAGHLLGQPSSGVRSGSHPFAIRRAILGGDAPDRLGEALAATARDMRFAAQPVRFLAQVIKRGPLPEGGPQREFLLATPLYVEDAHGSDEFPDIPVEGTVRWFSAGRGWGLVVPDTASGQGDAVVFDASAVDAADGHALATAQRVEFRVTRGAAGIQATAVRPLHAGDADPVLATLRRGQPLDPADPGRIGRYEVMRRLGDGSMGKVYLARGDDGLHVAVKVMRPEYARDRVFQRRFRAEADSARRVHSSNVARVITAVTDAGLSYLVTEFIDGLTLEEHVSRHGPLPAQSAAELSAGVAAALDAIHEARIVHRDLSPSNVILSGSGPKVIDFGIARALGSDTRHTKEGRPVGTPAYMSPEQIDEGALESASDIFSWAGLTVFAVTGHQPFGSRDSPVTSVWREISDGAPNLDGVPGQLRNLVASALSKDPAQRPTAAQLLERLSAGALAGQSAWRTHPRGCLPAARRMLRPRGRLAAGAAVMAAIIAALFLLFPPTASNSANTTAMLCVKGSNPADCMWVGGVVQVQTAGSLTNFDQINQHPWHRHTAYEYRQADTNSCLQAVAAGGDQLTTGTCNINDESELFWLSGDGSLVNVYWTDAQGEQICVFDRSGAAVVASCAGSGTHFWSY